MQYTLNITENCNMLCTYCRLDKQPKTMTKTVAYKAVDMIFQDKSESINIGFYGGEPLLCKDLIKDIVAYTKEKNAAATAHKKIYFKITTNGTLLDEDFLKYAKQEGILLALSLDGTQVAHDRNRTLKDGSGTYDRVLEIVPQMLKYNKYTPAMITVTPNNVADFAQSVEHIYKLGFIYLMCAFDYQSEWDEEDFKQLKRQYKKLAEFYYENTIKENKFFLSPFESKIQSHIKNREYCAQRCILGYEQIVVGADGKLYPCLSFLGVEEYCIGNVDGVIDGERRKSIFEKSRSEHPECEQCEIRTRCFHQCACMNFKTTGDVNEPSPFMCANERLLIPITDKVASRLYNARNGMFIQKSYNEFYSLVSLTEDSEKQEV